MLGSTTLQEGDIVSYCIRVRKSGEDTDHIRSTYLVLGVNRACSGKANLYCIYDETYSLDERLSKFCYSSIEDGWTTAAEEDLEKYGRSAYWRIN